MKIRSIIPVCVTLILIVAGCASRPATETPAPSGEIAKPRDEAQTPKNDDSSVPTAPAPEKIEGEKSNDGDISDAPSGLREAFLKAQERIEEDRGRALEHLKTAENLKEAGKLDEALEYAKEAARLDPKNDKAANLASELLARLGKTSEVSDNLQGSFSELQARRELVKRELITRYTNGQISLKDGRYAEAIEHFKTVIQIATINRLILDAGDYEKKARRQLAVAEDRKRAVDTITAADEILKSREKIEDDIKKSRAVQAREIEHLQEQMHSYRARRNYDKAIGILEIIMLKDKGNSDSYLRIMSELQQERAKWRAISLKYTKAIRSEQEMLKLDMLRIPTTELYKYDKEHWIKVLRRAEKIKEQSSGLGEISLEANRTLNMINARTLRNGFDSATLIGETGVGRPTIRTIKDYLRTEINDRDFDVRISKGLLEDRVDPSDENNILKLRLPGKIKLVSVLNHIARALDIVWEVDSKGILLFRKKDEVGTTNLIVRRYEVADIVYTLHDFKGEGIKGGTSSEDDIINPLELFDYDESGEDNKASLDDLKDLIIAVTPPGKGYEAWENREAEEEPAIWTYKDSFLHVRAPAETHKKIDKLLEKIRILWGIMVNIEARFITVERNFLETVGVEWRDAGPVNPLQFIAEGDDAVDLPYIKSLIPGMNIDAVTSGMFYSTRDVNFGARTDHIINSQLTLSSLSGGGGLALQAQLIDSISFEAILRAVRQNSNRQTLLAPRITCFNTQQASIFVGIKETYIKDYDSDSSSGIAEPSLAFVTTSTVFDIRPVVSHDRRYVTLFLRPTITFPPVMNYSTYQQGNREDGSPITRTIGLPTQDSQTFRTVIVVPDGGTVLIGGMGRSQETQQQSRIPILHKIPILGFFFRAETFAEARRQLLVLVKVKIIVADEEEKKL